MPQTGNTSLQRQPWSVDRWGRLLAGTGILTLTALSIFHHPAWLIGTLLASANLVVTSLSNRCPLHDLLIRLGAKEREDIFLPGGSVRSSESFHREENTHAVPGRELRVSS